jgi:hypothetical protein
MSNGKVSIRVGDIFINNSNNEIYINILTLS